MVVLLLWLGCAVFCGSPFVWLPFCAGGVVGCEVLVFAQNNKTTRNAARGRPAGARGPSQGRSYSGDVRGAPPIKMPPPTPAPCTHPPTPDVWRARTPLFKKQTNKQKQTMAHHTKRTSNTPTPTPTPTPTHPHPHPHNQASTVWTFSSPPKAASRKPLFASPHHHHRLR